MTAISQEVLERDRETVIARPRRHSCELLGHNVRRQIKRTGIERSMYDSVAKAWLIPIADLPAFIHQAEKDCRVVLVDDGAQP